MPMQRIIRKHGVVYHKYADDTQLYVTYKPNVPGDMQRAVKQLEDCISEIRVWMINRMLKLNDNKTDMVIYMSQYHLNKYGRCDISIGDSTISPVECVRNLGVQIDGGVQSMQLPPLQAVFYPPLYHNRCSKERSTGSHNI